LNPDIAALWHPTKNGSLTPNDVTPGSSKKVYWICADNSEHENFRRIHEQIKTNGFCRQCNSLAAKRPDLIDEWHPTNNGNLKPEEVSYASSEPVWWQCNFDSSHEWPASPGSRTCGNETGCPYCNKRASKLEIRVYTELLTLFPDTLWGEIVDGKECDVLIPSINIGIEIDGGFFHADKIEKDSVKNQHFKSLGIDTVRLREDPLPKISSIDIQHKKNDRSLSLMKIIMRRLQEVRPQLNDNAAINDYLERSELVAVQHYRERLAGLQFPPYEKSLEHLHPEIASTWDYELNEPWSPQMFTPGSEQEVYWHCPVNGHPSFPYQIKQRRKKNGCQICTGRQVTDDTSVAVMLDQIEVQWHPTKNLPLEPDQVRHREATRQVWWLCPECGHEWLAPPHRVIHVGTGCEPCSDKRGRRVAIRNKIDKQGSLADLRPDVVDFVDSDRSSDFDPTLVTSGSNDEVYVRCPNCEFKWPNKRSIKQLSYHGVICKECNMTVEGSKKVKNQRMPLSKVHPALIAFWHFDRDKWVSLDWFSRGSHEKIHLRCPTCGYRWPNSREIRNIAKVGLKCPECEHALQPLALKTG